MAGPIEVLSFEPQESEAEATDPDPQIFQTQDPEPKIFETLNLDPHKVDADPKHWKEAWRQNRFMAPENVSQI